MSASGSMDARAASRVWVWAVTAIAAGALGGALAGDETTARSTVAGVGVLAVAGVVAAILARPETGVWALLVVTPLTDAVFMRLGPLKLTPAGVVLAACLLSWTIETLRDGGPLAGRSHPGPVGWLFAAPFLAALWSLPLSLNVGKTAAYSARLLALCLMALFVTAHVRGERRVRTALGIVVATGIALTALASVQYAYPGLGIGRAHVQAVAAGEGLVRPSAFYLDPNFLAGYLSAASAAAFALAAGASRWRATVRWAAAGAVCVAGVLLTSSRSGLLGTAAALAIVVISAPRRRRAALAAAMFLCALLVIPRLPASFADRLAALSNPFATGSTATRYLMAGSTLEMIGDHWATGTGLAAYDRAYPAYRRVGALQYITRPHQLPLAMWAEMGVAGLIAELAIVTAAVWAMVRRVRMGWTPVDSALGAGIAALTVESLFQYYLYFECLWLFMALAAVRAVGEEAGRG